MKLYKLVSQRMTSYGGMRWQIGEANEATGEGTELCTDGVLHAYRHPALAVLMNPIHADIARPVLLEIDASEVVADDGTKVGTKRQTPVRVLPLPAITMKQRVEFAIRCALAVTDSPSFRAWAERWLSGEGRSAEAAWEAARAAWAAARAEAAEEEAAAAEVAEEAAAWAAEVAWAARAVPLRVAVEMFGEGGAA